ncbi:hypothetical protein SPI_06453 [Niveomyces insectorum RCEF 264]|uniref:Uncharacterized protein n=1 Tax=Niveomyces insectorum RCEF 264 TaxID=1081102 RepID=A0A167R994_9HYPO|nr:hypothetical protein SPI_06453 [Niveomyces insectorum RCEF 264]
MRIHQLRQAERIAFADRLPPLGSLVAEHGEVQPAQSFSPAVDTRKPVAPTKTQIAITDVLVPRAPVATNLIPAGYGAHSSGPSAGTVVGITLGAVGGFLLLVGLLYTCANLGDRGDRSRGLFLGGGGSVVETASNFGTASFVSRRTTAAEREERRASRHARRHHHHHHPQRETVELGSGSRRTRPSQERVERIERVDRVERIVEDDERRRRRRTSRPPPGATVVESVDDDEIVVEEEEEDIDYDRRRRGTNGGDDEDDEIVVIERDGSRPRPRPRSSRRGSSSRR